MPPRTSDMALRRLVAELAVAAPGDVQAVLGALDPRQRDKIDALLASYRGNIAPARVLAGGPAGTPPGVSPWLAARLSGDPGPFAMTGPALEALRRAAADVTAPGAPATSPPRWSERLRTAFLRGGRQ